MPHRRKDRVRPNGPGWWRRLRTLIRSKQFEPLRARLNALPLCGAFGLRCSALGEAEALVHLLTASGLRHADGVIPGVFIAALADAAGSFALWTLMAEEETHATTDLSIHFIRGAATETVTAHARVLRRARRVAFVSAELVDDLDRVCATATGTWMIAPSDP